MVKYDYDYVKYDYVVRTLWRSIVVTVNSYPTREEAERAALDIISSTSPFTADIMEVVK